MPRNNVRKGELRQIREWLVKLTEEIVQIRDNHLHVLSVKVNIILFVLVPCLVALVAGVLTALLR